MSETEWGIPIGDGDGGKVGATTKMVNEFRSKRGGCNLASKPALHGTSSPVTALNRGTGATHPVISRASQLGFMPSAAVAAAKFVFHL